MNSEELELSLRTEFEGYLKNITAEMTREVSDLQGKLDAEFAKHRAQLDQLVQDFSARVAEDRALEPGFKDAVVEHLRLARDEGARITATAFAEAEQLAKSNADQSAASAVQQIRKAIFDISTKNTQSAILKALVQHASSFTPRGIFFIVKNEQLVGWKCFGTENLPGEDLVREVSFQINQKTMPGTAVNLLSSVDSNFDSGEGDSVYLQPLGFGRPDKMYAIPLLVRGRAVAVVYADHGTTGGTVDIDALETIVRVAGLTVEILAAGRLEKNQPESRTDVTSEEERSYEPIPAASTDSFATPAAPPSFGTVPVDYTPAPVTADFTFEPIPSVETVSNPSMGTLGVSYNEPEPFAGSDPWNQPSSVPQNSYVPSIDAETPSMAPTYEFEPSEVGNGLGTSFSTPPFDISGRAEPASPVSMEPAPQAAFSMPPANPVSNTVDFPIPTPAPAPAPAVITTPPPVKSRFSDRNMELPIEVSEEERRMHNDARRFARLLVSEIKLYNEQKVREGREARDLYDRLRDAIDRSREMYDKRVQSTVAAKFDYFHYELVNTLAEGDASKLGQTYRH